MIEDFLHLPSVLLTPVANLELRRSLRIFEKIRNDPNGIIRGLWETDSCKKTISRKSRDTVPLMRAYFRSLNKICVFTSLLEFGWDRKEFGRHKIKRSA